MKSSVSIIVLLFGTLVSLGLAYDVRFHIADTRKVEVVHGPFQVDNHFTTIGSTINFPSELENVTLAVFTAGRYKESMMPLSESQCRHVTNDADSYTVLSTDHYYCLEDFDRVDNTSTITCAHSMQENPGSYDIVLTSCGPQGLRGTSYDIVKNEPMVMASASSIATTGSLLASVCLMAYL